MKFKSLTNKKPDLKKRELEGYNLLKQYLNENVSLNKTDTTISCGIKQLEAVSRLYDICDNIANCILGYTDGINELDDKLANLKIDKTKLIRFSVIHVLSHVINKYNCAFCLLSNNEDYPEMSDILDEVSNYQTEWVLNPNTNNNIKIWTIDKEQFNENKFI